ncbi:MAG: DUF433 domain-containing protein [Terracidiphilus sp.]|jgi:uncharacterized protein (DUF433 family)
MPEPDVVTPQDWGSGTLDWSGCSEVEVVPGKVSGTPILRNTRFPADSILDHYVQGHSVEHILECFVLDARQVQVVYDYCVLHASQRRKPTV